MNISRTKNPKKYNPYTLVTTKKVTEFIGEKNCIVVSGKKTIREITGFRPISDAMQKEMTFCSAEGEKAIELISRSRASVILCPTSLRHKILAKAGCTLIFVENPRLWFIRCIAKFSEISARPIGIHPTAVVETKKIAKGVYIGPYTYIAQDVTIDQNTVIHGGVHIYSGTTIGKNVMINAGVVIGEDGFGFEKNEKGEWEKFLHHGGVEIHDNIEIGANTCIDRGTLRNTVIGSGTKIDNLVHIAHNVQIGRNCIVIAQSLVAGSCTLEDGAYVAMCACIREGVRLGKNSFVGMGAVVTRDVQAGETVIGVPAHRLRKES